MKILKEFRSNKRLLQIGIPLSIAIRTKEKNNKNVFGLTGVKIFMLNDLYVGVYANLIKTESCGYRNMNSCFIRCPNNCNFSKIARHT